VHGYTKITLTISKGRTALLLKIQFFSDVIHSWARSFRYFEVLYYLRNVDTPSDTTSHARRLKSSQYIGQATQFYSTGVQFLTLILMASWYDVSQCIFALK